jgi:transcriptional regulator GlxA family with amidase domain
MLHTSTEAAKFRAEDPLASMLLHLIEQAYAAVDRCPRTASNHLREAKRLLACANDETEAQQARSPKGGLAPWQILRISSFMASNLARNLSGQELAGVVRLSPGHFCRAFKVSFGVPPHTYLRNHRLAAAQGLMMTTDDSLAEIAIECGFTDQSHLCHLFRRSVGLSPAAWRRRQLTLGSTSPLTAHAFQVAADTLESSTA